MKYPNLKQKIDDLIIKFNCDVRLVYDEYDVIKNEYPDLKESTFRRIVRRTLSERYNNVVEKGKNEILKDVKGEQLYWKEQFEKTKYLLNNFLSSRNANNFKNHDKIKIDPESKALVAQITDVHFGKVVDLEGDFEKLNLYNKEIALKRITFAFLKIKEIIVEKKIENVHIALEGDMLSGIIHEELKYYINKSLSDDIISLAKYIAWEINELKKYAKNVTVICVSGNHGRFFKKMEFEFMEKNNFDYLLYKMIESYTSEEINFIVSEGTTKVYNINGKNFLFNHGNFAKGGKNITGTPAFTTSRNSSFMSNMYKFIDIYNIEAIFFGHFHTRFEIPGLNVPLICSGSMIGPDSYSIENCLFFPAEQTVTIIDQKGRVCGKEYIKVCDIIE